MQDSAKLLEFLLRKNISRRQFLTRLSALSFTSPFIQSILNTSAYADTPNKGGRLRIGCSGGGATDTLDPRKSFNTMTILLNNQIRNHLIEIDADNNLIPELAESWEATPDAKTWIFKIRRGVEFHNGKTLESEDVIFSINLHKKNDDSSDECEEENGGPGDPIVCPIIDMISDGKYLIKFILNESIAEFPYSMSHPNLSIVPANTTNFADGIGTGGYILGNYEPGIRAITKRNRNYWKQNRAHFDEVETINIIDGNAKTASLTSNYIDVMSEPDLKTLPILKKVHGVRIVETYGKSHINLPMRTDIPPYNNNDVRLALKYSIDRKDILSKILYGYGVVGNDQPISQAYHYYSPDLQQREYNPDKARFHIKKAGLENDTFKLHASDAAFKGAVDTANLFKEHAAKAGINIEIVRTPSDGYWSDIWRKKPWVLSYWSGRLNARLMLSAAYRDSARWNETYWNNPTFNTLLKEVRSELDEARRQNMYLEMQKIIRDDGGAVIPAFKNYLLAVNKRLNFSKVSSVDRFDGYLLPERWWFSS